MSDAITREQFGILLYETITTIGGILGLDQQRAAAIHRHEDAQAVALLARRRDLQRVLAQQLPQLTHAELDQILARYPWVTGA